MTTTTQTRYLTQTETNKLIRAALRDAFPGIKFSVTGSGGNATTVAWTDGPAEKAVEDVARRFEGSSFDGMQDLASPIFHEEGGVRIHYGCSYVFTRRNYSAEITEQAQREVANAGIDPHGLNTLGEIPSALRRYEELESLLWRGYPADGPLLVRIIAGALATAAHAASVAA
jgi:hypothetical protein